VHLSLAPPRTTIVIGDMPFRSESIVPLFHADGLINVPAVRVSQSDLGHLTDQHLAQLLYGRPLTAGEVGAVLAHLKAYSVADAGPHDWALILEDDADLPGHLLERLDEVPWAEISHRPSILSLFSNTFVPRASKRATQAVVRRLWVPPAVSAAYLINRSAWSLALSSPEIVVSSADWPPWSMKVDYYALARGTGVRTVGTSTIPGRPSRMSLSRTQRVKRIIEGTAYDASRAYFASRRDMIRWYAVSPIRRIFGQSE
jgi:hypothetical protein